MIPFVAGGLIYLFEQIRMRDTKKVTRCLVIIALSAALVNVSLADVSFAKKFPKNYFVGLAFMKKGAHELALEEFEKELNKNPHFPEMRRAYGQTLIRLGREAEGIEQITIARDLAPSYAPIRRDLGRLYIERAEKLKERTNEGDLETSAKEKLLKESNQLIEKAIIEYEAAEKCDPFDKAIKYELALLYDQAGYPNKFKRKLRDYAAQHMKDNPDYATGTVLDQLGRFDEATVYYTKALEVNPTDVHIRNKLGVIFFKKSAYKKAKDYFAESLRIESENDEAHFYLGSILEKEGRLDEAIKHFTAALRIKPDSARTHNNLAIALVQKGELKAAIKQYAVAIKENPESAEFHNNIGVALFKSNDFSKAATHYNRAIELKPEYAEAYNNLGNLLVEQGMYDEAVKKYQVALRINPDSPEAFNNIGVAFARQGKHQEAIRYFKKALNLNPEYLQARKNLELALTELTHSRTPRDSDHTK
jgi:tetratricopeptide (TPR) repeat protein